MPSEIKSSKDTNLSDGSDDLAPNSHSQARDGSLPVYANDKTYRCDRPLVSVITVVFNGVQTLESTILSVLSQDTKSFEYIVIDGGSTDGTLDIIEKHRASIAYFISEADDGVYSAMNKGAALATGKYLHFLNSGDQYYENSVLSKLSPVLEQSYPLVVGSAEFVYTEEQRVVKPAHLTKFRMPNCHQACLYLSARFKQRYYSIDYRILADFKYWFDVFVVEQESAVLVDEVICSYDMNGLSNQRIFLALSEKCRIFHSSQLWRYKVLGSVDVVLTFLRIMLGKAFQSIGLRAVVVRLKLRLFD